MKKIIPLLLIPILSACKLDSDKITKPSDLATLALVLKVELDQENIKPVCSEEGLLEVEQFLERKSEREQQKYVNKVGAYLGECIIESYGGEWIEHEPGVWGVKLSDGNIAFPIAKVQKFVNDPTADSFSSFYRITPMIFDLIEKGDSIK